MRSVAVLEAAEALGATTSIADIQAEENGRLEQAVDDRFRGKPPEPGTTSLIVRKVGGKPLIAEVHSSTQIMGDGTRYAFLPEHRLAIPDGLPPGYLYIHPQYDPEPFSGREPKGLSTYDFEAIGGAVLDRLAGQAWEPPEEGFQWEPWMTWACIGLAVAVVVIILIVVLV